MESIAIISDIHSNLEALTTVLRDIEKRKIKRIFCLGDIVVKGSHPHDCIELVKEKCEVIVQGNCDAIFSKDYDTLSSGSKKAISWNQSMLTLDDRKFLSSLPLCHEFYMSGSLVRIFHATPTSNEARIGEAESFDEKFQQFKPSEYTNSQEMADVVIHGHVHTQMLNNIYKRTLIIAGSVGNSMGVIRNKNKDGKNMEVTRANYLIISGEYGSNEYSDSLDIEFVKLPYNINKELNSDKEVPDKEAYEKELLEGMYRDPGNIREYFASKGLNFDDI